MMQFFTNLDMGLFFMLNNIAGQSEIVDFLIIFFAHYLPYIVPIAFLALLYSSSAKDKPNFILSVFLSSTFAYLITKLIRFLYTHPRPPLLYNIQALLVETSNSFPSMHATFFFAFSFAIYFRNKKWGGWFIFFSSIIALARVMAGVHSPTDIFGGLALGWAVAFVLNKILIPKK